MWMRKIYLCDLKNSCTCVVRNSLKHITSKPTKQLNVSSKINEIIKLKTNRFFTHYLEKKCLPGFVYECSYKYSKFSYHRYSNCFCRQINTQCEEGYSYKCRRLPGWYPGLTDNPDICQCEKNRD